MIYAADIPVFKFNTTHFHFSTSQPIPVPIKHHAEDNRTDHKIGTYRSTLEFLKNIVPQVCFFILDTSNI